MPHTKDTRRKILALVRVSSDAQAEIDKTGLDRQREDIALHCKAYGLVVDREYELSGISGTEVHQSKQYAAMLDRLADSSIVGICFATLDRFFRPEFADTFSDVFKPIVKAVGRGKKLFCELGELSMTDPNDFMKLAIWGSMAGFERNRIRDRMVRGRKKMMTVATAKDSSLPRGVEFVPDMPIIGGKFINHGSFKYTPYAFDVVLPAFKRVAAGESLRSVAEDLEIGTKHLNKCERKPRMSVTQFRFVLSNRWWRGEKTTGLKTNLSTAPLVSQDLWDMVQETISHNKTEWTHYASNVNEFLITGLLHCACGLRMYHKTVTRTRKSGNTHTESYYICSGRATKKTDCKAPILQAHGEYSVDDLVLQEAVHQFSQPGFIEARIKEALAAMDTAQHQRTVKAAAQKVTELKDASANLQSAIRTAKNPGIIASFVGQIEDLENEITAAETKCRMAEKAAQAQVDPKAAAAVVSKDFNGFDKLAIPEQKAILARWVKRVDYAPPVCAGDFFNFHFTMTVPSGSKTENNTGRLRWAATPS